MHAIVRLKTVLVPKINKDPSTKARSQLNSKAGFFVCRLPATGSPG